MNNNQQENHFLLNHLLTVPLTLPASVLRLVLFGAPIWNKLKYTWNYSLMAEGVSQLVTTVWIKDISLHKDIITHTF